MTIFSPREVVFLCRLLGSPQLWKPPECFGLAGGVFFPLPGSFFPVSLTLPPWDAAYSLPSAVVRLFFFFFPLREGASPAILALTPWGATVWSLPSCFSLVVGLFLSPWVFFFRVLVPALCGRRRL